LRPDHLKSW